MLYHPGHQIGATLYAERTLVESCTVPDDPLPFARADLVTLLAEGEIAKIQEALSQLGQPP